MKKITERDIDTLARTLYGEAEANNAADAKAIAWVVMNRVIFPNWPDNVAEVCLQPWQFSCWNPGDPNRARIQNAKSSWFERCREIALAVINGEIKDPTSGSTHYYATYIKKPKWAKGKKPVYSVTHTKGHEHLFFNDIDTKPPANAREALEQVRPLGSTGTIKAARVGVIGTGAGAGAVATILNNPDSLTPAVPLLQTVVQYAPWLMVVFLLGVIGFMVWRRLDDRAKGHR